MATNHSINHLPQLQHIKVLTVITFFHTSLIVISPLRGSTKPRQLSFIKTRTAGATEATDYGWRFGRWFFTATNSGANGLVAKAKVGWVSEQIPSMKRIPSEKVPGIWNHKP